MSPATHSSPPPASEGLASAARAQPASPANAARGGCASVTRQAARPGAVTAAVSARASPWPSAACRGRRATRAARSLPTRVRAAPVSAGQGRPVRRVNAARGAPVSVTGSRVFQAAVRATRACRVTLRERVMWARMPVRLVRRIAPTPAALSGASVGPGRSAPSVLRVLGASAIAQAATGVARQTAATWAPPTRTAAETA